MNNPDAQRLRQTIARLSEDLGKSQAALDQLERSCSHQWGPVVPDFIHHKGYEYGDEPGTMGSDYIPKQWVSARDEPRWKRTCEKCGKVEYTQRTQEHVSHTPKF